MGDTPSSTPRQYGRHERKRERERPFLWVMHHQQDRMVNIERERENGHKMVRIFYFRLIAKYIFYG